MKKRTRIAAAVLAAAVGLGGGALAAGGLVDISVLPGMQVLVDGAEFVPTDANGKQVEVFSYNGTTYVPIRAMSEAFGLEVDYDAAHQAAVVSTVKAPDIRNVDYVLAHAPDTVTMDDGTEQTFYNDVEYNFQGWAGDQDTPITVELVSGKLPGGLTLKDGMITGQCQAAGKQDAVFAVTPKGQDPIEVTLHFVFTDTEFNAAPVVIWGVEGDEVLMNINSAYSGILYTGDDLSPDPSDPVTGGWGSSPIGTQAALDELARYGLTMGYETRNDGEWYWADNFVTGTLTGSTNGWVKISVPVYAGMGSDETWVEDGVLMPGSWWVADSDDGTKVLHGNVDIYLNIVGFE